MITIHDLKKEYVDGDTTTKALRGISVTIQKGEFVSIMGPSGSGKSTLLHIMNFLERASSGTYTFLDKSMEEMNDDELAHVRNKEMGFVFQSFNLLARLSVYDNVEVPLLYARTPMGERASLIKEAISAVGLEEKLYIEAGKLSGGQKQRVAIARALVNDPNIIFADEPTGNLDSESGLQIMEILESLNKKGRTVIMVTHETQTAEYANRIIRIKDGQVESDKAIEHEGLHIRHNQLK
jgi:putative ABC transport system ATP-binding protein